MAQASSWHPSRAVLEMVELALAGALPQPLDLDHNLGLDLDLDRELPSPAASGLTIQDAEGTPVAVLDGEGRWSAVRPFTHGPLRSRRRSAAQVGAELAALPALPGGGPVLAVPVTGPLTPGAVDAVLDQARAADARLLWLAVFGEGRARPLPPEGLWRAVQALAATSYQAGRPGVAVPVAVPLLEGRPELILRVAAGYGAELVAEPADPPTDPLTAPSAGPSRPAAYHPAFAIELARATRSPHSRGVTVFLTGLSGSGKSTIAKQFTERLLDDGRRTVTLLDGDEVRRLLSHGLGFSRADRDLNIRRIGYVAAEVTRHGGVAVCAPIAPFAQVRAQVRASVEEVGELVLVHVATPLAECERRDRKGLYAQARRGEIPDFTGISSPYEVPTDADLMIDTTGLRVADCVQLLWRLFELRGYLGPATSDLELDCEEAIGRH
jgi:sulfate adenylyltransferase